MLGSTGAGVMKAQQYPARSPPDAGPIPSLGVPQAAALIIGIVVGAGIYRTPSLVAGQAASESTMLGVWLLGGFGGVVVALGALMLPFLEERRS